MLSNAQLVDSCGGKINHAGESNEFPQQQHIYIKRHFLVIDLCKTSEP